MILSLRSGRCFFFKVQRFLYRFQRASAAVNSARFFAGCSMWLSLDVRAAMLSEQIDRAALAPAILLGFYCVVVAGFAFGMYELLQPKRTDNPGLAAYKPASGTVIALSSAAQLPDPAKVTPAAIELDPETVGASALQHRAEANKAYSDAKTDNRRRKRPVRQRERPDSMKNYALRPPSSGYAW